MGLDVGNLIAKMFFFCENCKTLVVELVLVVVVEEEGILSGRILLGGRRPPRDP